MQKLDEYYKHENHEFLFTESDVPHVMLSPMGKQATVYAYDPGWDWYSGPTHVWSVVDGQWCFKREGKYYLD